MVPTNRRPDAFTLIELLVVMAVVALLMALLMPALSKALESSRTTQCASNLRQIGLMQISYAGAFNRFPVDFFQTAGAESNLQDWRASLAKHSGLGYNTGVANYPHPVSVASSDRYLFRCPTARGSTDTERFNTSYNMNNHFVRFMGSNAYGNFGGITNAADARLKNPLIFNRPNMVLGLDGQYSINGGDSTSPNGCNPQSTSVNLVDLVRHGGLFVNGPSATGMGTATGSVSGGLINVLFTDGHVSSHQPYATPIRGGVNFTAGPDDRIWDPRQP